MKILTPVFLFTTALCLVAAPPESAPPMKKAAPAPPALYHDTALRPAPASTQRFVYEQKPLATPPGLIAPGEAEKIIGHFKAAYTNNLGAPRFLIYQLGDAQSGVATAAASTNMAKPAVASTLTLTDKQTVRDVERLFARPLRLAGATVVDQDAARRVIGTKALAQFLSTNNTPQIQTNRAALQQVADVLVEVLVSSRNVTVPTLSGDQAITLPDIQATAVRISDSKILGQAASNDVTSRVPQASLRFFDVNQITEATALVLMDDMTPETPNTSINNKDTK